MAEPRLDRLEILILDDHFFMRSIIRSVFAGFGFTRLTEAKDAAEAFMAMKERHFDLVVVDHHLGDLCGAEFARLVRSASDSRDRTVPIIGCTADTRKSTISELVNSGVDEILAKPLSSKDTWLRIAATVNRRRPFIAAPAFYGPDRRRRANSDFQGQDRRSRELVSL
jgi:two-component system, chemotaxis family, chemotaxis protein CheY